MDNIMILGASGNVGREIIKSLVPNAQQRIWTTTRCDSPEDNKRYFDFDNLDKSVESLKGIDVLFFLRPPALSNITKYFKPLILGCKKHGIKHIIFLSVQGADLSRIIPHSKIERLIIDSRIPYTFVRPSYFMQNLTTTLLDDIKLRGEIMLPSGAAKFLWVDVADIGKSIAHILTNVAIHQNKVYTITGTQLLGFAEVTESISRIAGKTIVYHPVSPLSFYFHKRKQGLSSGIIIIMIILHFLPRIQAPPKISDDFRKLTGERPRQLSDFIERSRKMFS